MLSSATLRQMADHFVSRSNPAPLKLPEYSSLELPDPARERWRLIAVTDKGCAAISNGVAWVRADGGVL